MISLFFILLCHKIDGDLEHREVAVSSTYGESRISVLSNNCFSGVIFMPVWIVLTAFGFLSCKLF